jgi:3'(2'), 5'-bisphosphate nucleotidase
MRNLLQSSIQAAIKAGKEIMKVYETDFSAEYKADNSPLTEADKRAHKVILNELKKLNIPVLSEEGKDIPFSERKNWKQLWIVDPLDGTKEFVKRNGEFTVNIALVEDNYPVLGVIYVPVKKILYFASKEIGAFICSNINEAEVNPSTIISTSEKLPLNTSILNLQPSTFKIVASRSHMSNETEMFVKEKQKEFEKIELISMGSSLKICLVAEGSANAYPRFAPTMEWDTASGQAIAEAAGCRFIDFTTKQRMKYNKENLLNNWFLVEK